MTSPPPPPLAPPLSLHLADTSLKPLLSTAPPPSPQAKSLRALTTAALGAHTSASRLGLGYPVHILVETQGGPVAMHAFLDPEARRGEMVKNTGLLDVRGVGEEEALVHGRILGGSPDVGGEEEGELGEGVRQEQTHGQTHGHGHAELANGVSLLQIDDPEAAVCGEEDAMPLAPMLVATVVAESYSRASEARRAVRRLEVMGREFQEQWVREREEVEEGGEEGEAPLGEREVEASGTEEVRADAG